MSKLGEYIAGDAIKVTTTTDTTPTGVTIDVYDADGTQRVTSQAMTGTTTTWTYTFQSASSWPAGKTYILTTATTATYENVQEDYVILVAQTN